MVKVVVYYALLGLLLSCSQSTEPINTSFLAPKTVAAIGYVVPSDSIQLPVQIPVRLPTVVKVGKPKIIPIATNQHFSPPEKIKAGKPTICVAGQNGYSLPQRVVAIHKPFVAGIPEKIISKVPTVKDQNTKNISTFGLSHGLKNLNISEIVQDKFGNLWIATGFGGVSKYDGKSFTNYTEKEGLINNTVLNIFKDQSGNLWFSTVRGASRFDGKNFTNYTQKEGLVNNLVYQVFEDKQHNIWFATFGGISRLDSQQKIFTTFTEKEGLPFTMINRIYEDKQGTFWLGTYKHGLANLRISQTLGHETFTFTSYPKTEGLRDNTILSIFEDASKNLWFGTDGGIYKYSLNTTDQDVYFNHFTTKNGLTNNTTNTIIDDRNGNILFGTDNGITIYEPPTATHSGNFTHLTEQEGLPDHSILSLFEDNLGNIWIGTESGFCKYSPNSFSFLTEKDGLSGNITLAILEDKKGNIWLGTYGGGVTKYQPPQSGRIGTFTHYTTKEGLSDDVIYAIYEDRKGNIWFGTRSGGVTKYTPSADGESDTFTHYTEQQGLIYNFVTSILEDKSGNMWFGQQGEIKGGASKFDGKTVTNFSVKQGLNRTNVWSIAEDKNGYFWFGTWGDGITKYEPAPTGKKGKFTHFSKKDGLCNDKVRPIKVDASGAIWFGTIGGGLSKYEEDPQTKTATFTHYSEQEGLSNNDVRSILEDRKGNLWFGNYYGISKFLPKADRKNKPFVNFTQEDGFLGVGCMVNSICEDKNGRIWIGTFKKITIFDPKKALPDTTLPNVQLTDIKLFNEKTIWQKDTSFVLRNGIKVGNFDFKILSNWYNIPEQLSLPYNSNFITFDFVGINTNTPQAVRYQYQLKGLENTWSSTTNRSEASYGNLSPGQYIFKVKARSGEGDWNKGFAYAFTIRPPWWGTWWAYLIYCVITGCLVYAIIYYRVTQGLEKIKALEAIRTKISSDLHDDVGSILSGLAMQSQMMALTAKEDQKESLNEISAMSHEAMDHMRDTVWAIDSRKDKYENLIDRMRAVAEKNLNRQKITHDFDIAIDDARKFIDPQKRQNIYLIFKEAISNICKHSDARHVTIKFYREKDHLYLLIHDNGSALKNTNSDGLGLHNMHMRAAQMGGRLIANYEDGFKVEFVLG